MQSLHLSDQFVTPPEPCRSYSPSFCQTERCSRQEFAAFSIHGLWPENNDGSWPEYCDAIHSESKETDEMRCEWPSFTGTDVRFHDHEWYRHGTCAHLGNRTSFMTTVVGLHRQYDINSVLIQSGLLPHPEPVQKERYLDVLSHEFQAQPLLSCTPKGTEIVEIWMCLDLSTLLPIQCPTNVQPERPCGTLVSLPAGPPIEKTCAKYFPKQQFRRSDIAWLTAKTSAMFLLGIVVTAVYKLGEEKYFQYQRVG